MTDNSIAHHESLEERARALIEVQPYFRGAKYPIALKSFEKVLLVTGQVPSYYLKQVLQSELMRLDGVVRIENQVQVDQALGS